MKKRISLLLTGAVALSLLLPACSAQTEEPAPTDTPKAVQTEAASAAVSSVPAPSAEPAVEPAIEPVPVPLGEPAQESRKVEEEVPAPEPSAVPTVSATKAPAVVSTPAPAVSATKAPAVVSTPAPVVEVPAEETPEAAAPQPMAESTPEPAAAPAATKEAAMAFVGRSVSSMVASIGQPLSRSYAPSCMGPGEDGELIYNGFTVYTYREGGAETVQDVI